MARPSFFGEKKLEVVKFIKALSNEYRMVRRDALSLNMIAGKLRERFDYIKRFEAEAVQVKKERAKKRGVRYKAPKNPEDALKLVIYRLCNTESIWFGDCRRMPLRMKDAKVEDKKSLK